MRLIDADALIEEMRKIEEQYENAMICPSWWSAFGVIKEHPTAYDIEKVISELESEKILHYGCHVLETNVIKIDDAVQIVKRGGV